MKLFIDTGSVAEVEEIAAWGVLSGATTNPSLLAKEDGEPGREHPPHLRAGGRAGLGRGRLGRRARDGRRGPRAGGARRPRRREGAVLARGPRRHARARVRRHPGEHDARVLRRAGAAHRRGGRDLRVLLHGPARRHLGRLRVGGGRDRRRARPEPRGAGARGVDAPPDARGDRRAARLRGVDDPRQGAEGDAGAPAHRVGDRALRRRLEEPPRVRRVAARARGQSAAASR